MKYLEEFRDPEACRRLVNDIRRMATRRWTLMEVCGGQTHGLLRYGIDQELAECVELIHGPGCPVCVTPLRAIDLAIELSLTPNVTLTSFGDMLRVPGSRTSLLQARAAGGDTRIVYSPLDAVQLAKREPNRHFVFFAVGFETTTPATALAVHQARSLGLDNFSLLVWHVRVQPAMEMLVSEPDNRVQGFLAAGHVCTVAGYAGYESFVERFKLPVVVTGFEPVDLLLGIRECVELLEAGTPRACNRYKRSVDVSGNRRAAELIDEVYEICDQPWRGLGIVPAGGLRLRPAWSHFDATARFPVTLAAENPCELCRSGEILTGQLKPTDCEQFGRTCTPEHPLGAPMVSEEGACSAYYRYARRQHQQMELARE